MRATCCLIALALTAAPVAAQETPLPPRDRTPTLRLVSDAPAARVTSLALNGATLFAGGLDKVVRTYALRGGEFREAAQFRLPVGPGNAGAVNAVAVSPDGRWLAAAGRSPMREEAKFGEFGQVVESRQLPGALRRDLGVVYLFDRANANGGKVLRGLEGEVRALAFATPPPAGGPVLVAAATERTREGKLVGTVQAWDVTTGKVLGSLTDFPAAATPGLAAWSAGGRDLRVAVAWPRADSKAGGDLMLWDVAANTTVLLPDGTFNSALAVRVGADGAAREVVSGGFWNYGGAGPQFGRLVVRNAAGPGDGRAIEFRYDAAEDKHFLPRAVAPAGDGLAVLLTVQRVKTGEPSTELRLLGADGATRARVPLADIPANALPVLAANDRLVAVAGFADDRIEVFETPALAAGKAVRKVIPGAAGEFAGVAFLADDKLWAGAASDTPERGGVVFDIAARKVSPNEGRDKPDTPKSDAVLTPDPKRTPAAVVVKSGGREAVCTLRGKEKPTADAHLPAGPAWNKGLGPVVAVAHTDEANAVTLITLFDGATGRPLRKLVGPERPVRALAFSASKPLLAAVGDGRSIAVWSLKDLDKQTGVIEGLFVTDTEGGAAVGTVAADAPEAVRALKPKEVIEAVGAGAKPDPVKRAWEFRAAVGARPVGGTVAVRVKGRANPVVLPVGRGVEQREPLFTVWLGPAGGEWVGWSPAGPYDASSPKAEARIGWLTATGDPAAPTTFAGADQYRKAYYRRGVLGLLAEKQTLDAALEAVPAPVPRMWAEVVAGRERAGAVPVLRDGKTTLRVGFTELSDAFPFERAVVRWRGRGPGGEPGPWQDVPLAGRELPLAIDLSAHRWSRGRHSFEVTLHRTPDSPPEAGAADEVVFVLPPPKLTASLDGKPTTGQPLTTERDAVRVAARVDPSPGTEAEVSLHWSDPEGKPHSRALATSRDGAFGPDDLKLEPGVTTLTIMATNRGAGEYAALESDPVEVRVTSAPPRVPAAPRVGKLVPTPGGEVRLIGDRPVRVVDVAKVRFAAEFEADDPITAVEWDEGDGVWKPAAAEPGGSKKLTAARELVIPPGDPRTVRVRARAGKGKDATAAVEVAYHPPLPAAQLGRLPASTTAREIAVSGTVGPSPDAPVRVAVVADGGGKTRTADAVVDARAGTWKATLPLEPGVNRLGLRVGNGWREESIPNVAEVTYRRPPRVLRVEPVDAGAKAVAAVTATVVTEGPEPTALVVNGRAVDAARRVLLPLPGVVCWELTAPVVPVRVGGAWLDRLAVAARNAEGDGEPVAVPVRRKPVELRPPVVSFADGDGDRATDRPRFAVRFKVESPGELTSVELALAGPDGRFVRVAAPRPGETADGFTATADEAVELRPGVNRVRVTAVGIGGETTAGFAVNYTRPAARILLDAVEELAADRSVARTLARRQDPSGEVFDGADTGFVAVRGRVLFSADDDPAARDPALAAVLLANRVGHLPVQLEPAKAGSRERAFRAPVFLNADDTHVRVELRAPGRGSAVPLQSVAGAEFRVRCRNPLTKQRLHVVVVGVGVPMSDRPALARRVVEALGGSIPPDRTAGFDQGEFRLPAFDLAVLYPPKVGQVARGDVGIALDRVYQEVRRRGGGPDGWVNDVVLLYYQGRDWVGPDGRRWLHTSLSLINPESAIPRFAVAVDELPTTPGVQLVLLNVADPTADRPTADALATVPPLLRYAWKDDAATGHLFPPLRAAVASRRTFGEVARDVRARLEPDPERSGEPIERLPPELDGRRLGGSSP